MAAATTSPVKILTDLGYEIWEMEIPEDYRSALIEAINTLIMTNPSDGRIPILQEAIKTLQKPKFKAKKTRINISKVLNKTQPKLEGQKLQEDSVQSEDNFLVDRLDNIASSLSEIGGILGSQLSLERIAYERKRRRDLLNEKREREKSLEDEGNTIGKNIKKIIAQPIKSFGERLLTFLKSIALGAAVLSLYKWLQDDENLKKVKAIADWLGDNGGKLIKSLIKLGRLGVASKIGNLLKKVGSVFTDFLFVKPIKTLTEIIRRSIGEIFNIGGIKTKQFQTFKMRKGLIKVLEESRKFNPDLMKNFSKREFLKLTDSNIMNALKRRGFEDIEIAEILQRSYNTGELSKGQQLFIGNTISNARKGIDGEKLSTIIENPPTMTDNRAVKDVGKEITGKKADSWMKKLLKFLERKGLKDVDEVKSLRKLIFGGVVKGLNVLDIGLDGYDAYRTFNEDKKVSSAFYALAALTSAATLAGAPQFGLPSLGFSLLGMAYEDEKFNKGAQLGMELDPSSAFGMGGGDPFLNLLMKKREERREIEKNLNIQGDKNKIGDQSSLMPNDFNNSGSNISFLGNNGTQSGSGSGNSSGSNVLVNDSENSEDPLIPSVAGVFNSPSALT